jgi:hypothetical protein
MSTIQEQIMDESIQDVLLSNKTNGMIGLTPGIDLARGVGNKQFGDTPAVSIFTLGFSKQSFVQALNKGALVHYPTSLGIDLIPVSAVIAKEAEMEDSSSAGESEGQLDLVETSVTIPDVNTQAPVIVNEPPQAATPAVAHVGDDNNPISKPTNKPNTSGKSTSKK